MMLHCDKLMASGIIVFTIHQQLKEGIPKQNLKFRHCPNLAEPPPPSEIPDIDKC